MLCHMLQVDPMKRATIDDVKYFKIDKCNLSLDHFINLNA